MSRMKQCMMVCKQLLFLRSLRRKIRQILRVQEAKREEREEEEEISVRALRLKVINVD